MTKSPRLGDSANRCSPSIIEKESTSVGLFLPRYFLLRLLIDLSSVIITPTSHFLLSDNFIGLVVFKILVIVLLIFSSESLGDLVVISSRMVHFISDIFLRIFDNFLVFNSESF